MPKKEDEKIKEKNVSVDAEANLIKRFRDVSDFSAELKKISRSKEIKELNSIKQRVIKALTKCIDPELGSNLVELGFIYGMFIEKDPSHKKRFKVKIIMTLTSPFCPMSDYLVSEVKNQISKIKKVSDVEVEVSFDPQWNPSMLTKDLQNKFFNQFIHQL